MRLATFLRICLLLVSVIAIWSMSIWLAQLDLSQGIAHRFGAHLGGKGLRAVGLARLAVFLLAQQLVALQGRRSRIDHQVVLVIDHALEVARGHVQHQADAGRHALEEPDMADGHCQFDMAHALTAHPRERDFHAAPITDHAAVLDAFVLPAGAFPVLDGAEDPLTEQAALLGLERAVIDGLGVLDLPFGPSADGLGRGDGNRHVFHLVHLLEPQQLAGAFFGADHKDLSVGVRTFKRQPGPTRVRPAGQPGWNSRL